MHYKTLLRNGAVIITAAMLTLTACKKSKTDNTTTTTPALTNTDDNGGYASDAAKLEANNNDVISIVDLAQASGSANLRTTGAYPVVTNDTSTHKITIDFGPTNHLCVDGKNRRGVINVSYIGKYKDSASQHTITFSNYFVEDVQRTGTKTVINNGHDGLGRVYYGVQVNDSLIFAPDSIISWIGTRTRTWTAGYSTAVRSDDAYEIGGITTLTRANGHTFTHTISSSAPLKVEWSCSYIESGIVTVSSSTFTGGDRTIDYGYGTGGCDNQAQLTVGKHTYVITLR